MVAISSYTIDVAYRFDQKSIRQVDKAMKLLEKKMKTFSSKMKASLTVDISKFNVNQKKLNVVLGDALDRASMTTAFEINRFSINQSRLNRSMQTAVSRATSSTSASVEPRVRGTRGGTSASHLMAGGAGGLISRAWLPAVGLGAVGYGLGAVNTRNQEVVAAQLQTQAVSQAFGGTAQQGQQSFDWLRKQAERVGFNYLQAAPDFNTLTANLLGAGGTVEQSKNIFKGFSEYGRVNKLSAARQNLVFNALSQIAGKNALQAEELTRQLGNSLPGAKNIFAQAWQRKIGGNLTGQEAIAALEAAMKKGLVKGDILNYAADIASAQAAPGLTTASKASQAEQARYQNTVNDMAIVASNSGVEEDFARIFRTLNSGLSESSSLVKSLANGFNEATKWADDLVLFPQDFMRALEGRDSVVADWLGKEGTAQVRADWESIKNSINTISSGSGPAWFPSLKDTTKEIASYMRVIGALSGGDFSGFGGALKGIGESYLNKVTMAGRGGANFLLRAGANLIGTEAYQFTGFGSEDPNRYISPSLANQAQAAAGFTMPLVKYDPFTNQEFNQPDPFKYNPYSEQNSPNAFGTKAASLNMSLDVSIDTSESSTFKEGLKNTLKKAVSDFVKDEYGVATLQFPATE